MSKLYEITHDYQKMLDIMSSAVLLERETAKESAFDFETSMNAELDQIKDSFENKVIAVAKYIRNLEAEAEAIEKAVAGMLERNKRLVKKANSFREYLQYNIERTGLCDNIKCPEFEIKIKTNPEKVNIVDESLIPDVYLKEKTVKSLDIAGIKKDIQSGFDVDGAELIRTRVLVIK